MYKEFVLFRKERSTLEKIRFLLDEGGWEITW